MIITARVDRKDEKFDCTPLRQHSSAGVVDREEKEKGRKASRFKTTAQIEGRHHEHKSSKFICIALALPTTKKKKRKNHEKRRRSHAHIIIVENTPRSRKAQTKKCGFWDCDGAG